MKILFVLLSMLAAQSSFSQGTGPSNGLIGETCIVMSNVDGKLGKLLLAKSIFEVTNPDAIPSMMKYLNVISPTVGGSGGVIRFVIDQETGGITVFEGRGSTSGKIAGYYFRKALETSSEYTITCSKKPVWE